MNTNLLTPQEAAKYIGTKPNTLAVWRCTKRYDLPFVKIGRKVFYRARDVEDFILDNLKNINSHNNHQLKGAA